MNKHSSTGKRRHGKPPVSQRTNVYIEKAKALKLADVPAVRLLGGRSMWMSTEIDDWLAGLRLRPGRHHGRGGRLMGYKAKGGKVVRGVKKTLKLYHLTPPYNLPDILRDGILPHTRDRCEDMLPGVDAV